jgi:hypothetical protein
VLPGIEWQVERQRTQVFEEGAPRRQLPAHALIALIVQIEQCVGEKRQQDEAREQVGQMLFAVAVVVLEAIALGLERIVVFVLDLPAAAPRGDDRDDVVPSDRHGAGPGIAVEHVALGIGRGQLAPADFQGIVAVAQRQIVEPAIGIGQTLRAVPTGLDPGGHLAGALEIGHPLIEQRMGARLTDEDELAALRQDLLAERLMAVQVVTQHGGAPRFQLRTPALQPTRACIELAVLFGLSVLRHDELRGQGQDRLLSGGDDHRRDRRVVVLGLAIGQRARGALRAVNRLRAMVFGAVERHQQPPVEHPVRGQSIVSHDRLHEVHEQRRDMGRGNRIEQVANLLHARDLLDPEQRAGVVAPPRLLHPHLKIEKRRALHEEHRERTQSGIAHRVALVVAALACIRQGAQHLTNRGNQRRHGPLRRRGLRLEYQGTLQ